MDIFDIIAAYKKVEPYIKDLELQVSTLDEGKADLINGKVPLEQLPELPVANAVLTIPQMLSEEQKIQARRNIDALADGDMGDYQKKVDAVLQTLDKTVVGAINEIYAANRTLILRGYYFNNKFYTDATYTVELDKNTESIYIDLNSRVFYQYDGEKFISVNDTLIYASDDAAGIMKLYSGLGQNTMVQSLKRRSPLNLIKSLKFQLMSLMRLLYLFNFL